MISCNNCHYESNYTCPSIGDYINASNLVFNNCEFVSNFSILNKKCVYYNNCKFNVGFYGNEKYSKIFTLPIGVYSCTFNNCITNYPELIIDTQSNKNIYNTPIYCNLTDYDIEQIQKNLDNLTFSEQNNTTDEVTGEYQISIFIHLNNDLSKYIAFKNVSINKLKEKTFLLSNYKIRTGSGLISIYITKPNGEIFKTILKPEQISSNVIIKNNSLKLNSTYAREYRIAYCQNCAILMAELNGNQQFSCSDTLQRVDKIPELTYNNEISKY